MLERRVARLNVPLNPQQLQPRLQQRQVATMKIKLQTCRQVKQPLLQPRRG